MFRGYLTGKPYPRDTHENQLSPSCHDSSHSSHVQYTLGSISKSFCHFYMTPVHILRGRNYISCAHLQGRDIPQGRCIYQGGEEITLIRKLCFASFSLWLFSYLLYGALSYIQYLCFVVFIASCLYVRNAYILMLLCFIECMFERTCALLCDHCSHFYMTILVYDQVAHMFHIMFI